MEASEKPWIGVDLDGTLARYYGWKGAEHIGSPIRHMVNRVRRWHNAGKCVKIFTARADSPENIRHIKAWLKKHRLPDLEVTNVKDRNMTQLWDDRAVKMVRNKGTTHKDGRIAESVVSKLLENFREFPEFVPYWVDTKGHIHHAVPGGHIVWARANVLHVGPEFQGVLGEMQRRGWLRMAVKDQQVLINVYRAAPTQLRSVQDWAATHHKTVYDDQTQRPYDG